MSTNSVHVQNNMLTHSSQPRRDALEASHAPRIAKLLRLSAWGVLRCGRPFWLLGAAFGCGSAPGGNSVPRTFHSMKEPYQDMIWALYIRNRLENRGVGAPKTRHERVSYSLPWRSGLLCPLLSSSHLPHSTVLRRHGVPSSIHRVGCRRRTRERAGYCPGEGRSVPSWVYLRISHPATHGARSCCCRRRRAVPWQSRRA
jgi:hypothetical protein